MEGSSGDRAALMFLTHMVKTDIFARQFVNGFCHKISDVKLTYSHSYLASTAAGFCSDTSAATLSTLWFLLSAGDR
jgi:hypothetical protein